VQAYRFFFPNISIAGMMAGFEAIGAVDNKAFLVLEGRPNGVLFTPNSDTPYAWIPLNLKAGPIVVELPAGPLIGAANDLNFRWVIDMGLPGPDAGKGGKHIILPPGWTGKVSAGDYGGGGDYQPHVSDYSFVAAEGRYQERHRADPERQDSAVEPACRLGAAHVDERHREDLQRHAARLGERPEVLGGAAQDHRYRARLRATGTTMASLPRSASSRASPLRRTTA